MGLGSLFGKLRKILEKPQPPAYMQQSYVEVPWHTRIWEAIRPPSAVPSGRAPMNTTQRRMILTVLAVAIPAAAIWAGISYVAGAPQRARAAFEEGMSLVGANNFTGAVAKFNDSLAIREEAHTYLERGNAYKNLGQNEDALQDWERAIGLDSGLAAAFTARATHFRVSGEYAKALPDLDASIQLSPSVDAYFQRGQVYAALGDYAKAIADYDRSIFERRDAPYVYLARSMAKKALGDEEGYRQDQATAAGLQGLR